MSPNAEKLIRKIIETPITGPIAVETDKDGNIILPLHSPRLVFKNEQEYREWEDRNKDNWTPISFNQNREDHVS